MATGHGAVVIGSEMSGAVSDIEVSDCVFVGTDRGIRLKTRRGRGGAIERLKFHRVRIRDVGAPLSINMYYKYTGADGTSAEVQDRRPRPLTAMTPTIREIECSGLDVAGARWVAGFVLGLPEQPVHALTLRDVAVVMAEQAEPHQPDMAVDLPPMARAGFLCTNATALALRNVTVANQIGPQFVLENVHRNGES